MLLCDDLAEGEERPFHAVEASLMEAGSDTLRFGVSTMRHIEDGLPLNYASRAIEGAEKALPYLETPGNLAQTHIFRSELP